MFMLFSVYFLERQTNSKVQSLCIVEVADVVEAASSGLVRHVQTDTPVKTDDEERQIIT